VPPVCQYPKSKKFLTVKTAHKARPHKDGKVADQAKQAGNPKKILKKIFPGPAPGTRNTSQTARKNIDNCKYLTL